MIRRLFTRRPWFRLELQDGDRIEGRQELDRSLELKIKTGWTDLILKLKPEEVEVLVGWLVKIYIRRKNDGRIAAVLPLSQAKGDPGPGPGGTGA